MSKFFNRIATNSTLLLIALLRKMKRVLFSVFLLSKRIVSKLGRLILKRLILPIYKICLLLKKWSQLIWGHLSLSLENKIFALLTHRGLIHLFVFLITSLVIVNNLQAEAEQDQAEIKSILSNLKKEKFIEEEFLKSPTDSPTKRPALKIQPYLKERQEEEISLEASLKETSLVKPIIPLTSRNPRERKEIEYYLVEPGDTISQIAQKFGLKTNTVLWANNLSAYSIIRPGQKLTILPVDGLLHKVKRGETLEGIAKKYKIDLREIAKINKLTLTSPLEIGKELIIPGAQKSTPVRRFFRRILQPRFRTDSRGHRFPWGYCTWYVAQKRYIPWGGHAKYWLANARRYGYSIGHKPVVGAIMVTRESWWGHVAYVEEVKGNRVTISEMNHYGRGIFSRRTFHTSDRRIIGYIY
jgi:surface antigen/transposase-like protein